MRVVGLEPKYRTSCPNCSNWVKTESKMKCWNCGYEFPDDSK